jgi:multiple sugar transport system ATP-binding protein
MARVPRDEIRRRVDETATLLHIEDLLHRRPVQLSGGQRQRVAIGRALVRKVHVFLFDEPLSNLDAALRTELRVELKRLHRELGNSTMIYVTHDQIEALTLADRIAVMHAGIIQQLDAPMTIYHKPANKFVAAFVGSPKMNFFPGGVEQGADGPVFATDLFSQPLDGYDFADGVAVGPAELGIRPEHIRIDADGAHALTVELVEAMGAETVVWCQMADATISLRLDGNASMRVGDTLRVTFPIEHVSLFHPQTGARL